MSDSNGGFGGTAFGVYPELSTSDMKLIRRAVRNNWDISNDFRQRIIKRMADIIDASDDDELAMRAAAIVIDADRVNVARERNDIEAEKPEQAATTKITQINYNLLSVEELLQLLEFCQKAGLASQPDERHLDSLPGPNGHPNGTG